MEQQKYKKWEELTPAEKEAWWAQATNQSKTYTRNDLQKNNISESDKLIDSCFEGCGHEWDELKRLMKQDDSFKLQRTVKETDKYGHIIERKEFY